MLPLPDQLKSESPCQELGHRLHSPVWGETAVSIPWTPRPTYPFDACGFLTLEWAATGCMAQVSIMAIFEAA